ncbi:MAG: hypothetical protein PUD07_03250 [bacterium]|nr:hypothetical protein [bacterium]
MNKRKNGLIVWIVFAIIIILALFCIFYFTQLERKKEFDNLYNKDYYLRVNYGVIESKGNNLRDLGVFLKENDVEKNYYLYITKDNILYTYFTDSYYIFDPLNGYYVEYKINLEEDVVQNILNDIRSKKVNNLLNKTESEYNIIRIDNENYYISKKDLQLIFQNYDIILDI